MELRIKDIIKERGTSIQNIADAIGINRVTLSNSINGNPTIETLDKIAKALDVDVTELFKQPSKDGLIGIVRYNGKPYEINSIDDIKKLLSEIEGIKE